MPVISGNHCFKHIDHFFCVRLLYTMGMHYHSCVQSRVCLYCIVCQKVYDVVLLIHLATIARQFLQDRGMKSNHFYGVICWDPVKQNRIYRKYNHSWWFIYISKWCTIPFTSRISRLDPLTFGIVTHLLSGVNQESNPFLEFVSQISSVFLVLKHIPFPRGSP